MSDLSERARELGEWLRGTESHVTEMAETAHRDGQRVLAEINFELAALFKSRAETLESLLAENERMRAEIDNREARRLEILDWLQRKIGTAWICDHCGYSTYHAYGRECADCGSEFPIINMLAFKLHASHTDRLPPPLNGEPAVVPSSVSGQAEPESDPGLPAGSSPETAEVILLRAELAEMIAVVERASGALLEASGALAGTKYFRTAARASAELLRDARAIVSRHRDHAKPPKVTPDA